MAKRVRLSDDNGSNWYTLPGNSAEFAYEAGALDDTIFGQDFGSTFPGIKGWTVNANAHYKGYAGYQVKLLKSGSTTAFTTEAMTLVSGKTYKITNAVKNVWDRSVTTNVFDNGVNHNADVESIDWLFGRVTFASGYSVTGPVTVTGSYFPMAVVGCANEYTLTQTANAIDTTCIDTAQANGGNRTFDYGLKTVSLELNGVFKAANGFRALLASQAEIIIEVNPDGASKAVARGFYRPLNTGQSGDVGDLEQENITFNLSVPDQANVLAPFKWLIDSTATLNTSIQKALTAWQASSLMDVQYLYDGTNGVTGDVVLTDLTLTGGLEAMNTFAVNMQGSGALTAVP